MPTIISRGTFSPVPYGRVLHHLLFQPLFDAASHTNSSIPGATPGASLEVKTIVPVIKDEIFVAGELIYLTP